MDINLFKLTIMRPVTVKARRPFHKWCVCILLIITVIWTMRVFRETKMPEKSHKISYLQAFTNMLGIFTERRIRVLYFINFLLKLIMK